MFTRLGQGIVYCVTVSLCVTSNQALELPSIVAGTNGLANTTSTADTTTSNTTSTLNVVSVLSGRCKTLLDRAQCLEFATTDDGRFPDEYHRRVDGPAPPGCVLCLIFTQYDKAHTKPVPPSYPDAPRQTNIAQQIVFSILIFPLITVASGLQYRMSTIQEPNRQLTSWCGTILNKIPK